MKKDRPYEERKKIELEYRKKQDKKYKGYNHDNVCKVEDYDFGDFSKKWGYDDKSMVKHMQNVVLDHYDESYVHDEHRKKHFLKSHPDVDVEIRVVNVITIVQVKKDGKGKWVEDKSKDMYAHHTISAVHDKDDCVTIQGEIMMLSGDQTNELTNYCSHRHGDLDQDSLCWT